ncbi:MAG: cell shape determination protein CcmA [Bacteroidetes bacterium]|nr:MAG: cell shape determination protein CcmA [Bacteroidota bacterium]
MFNAKSKSDAIDEKPVGNSTSLIGAGTSLKGDITSNGDLRIDGSLVGNIICSAKVVIGANGTVEGDISGQQADIMGKVTGTIKVKDLLQLKSNCIVNGNLQSSKLQIEPTANFNGQCHMLQEETKSANGKATSDSRKEAISHSAAIAVS